MTPYAELIPLLRRDIAAARPDRFADWSRLYWRDREAFVRGYAAAKSSQDPSLEIAATQVLQVHVDIGPKPAMRLWRRLLDEGRPAEALEVLQTNAAPHQGSANYWRDLALALAQSGLMGEAALAVNRGVELGPSDELCTLQSEILTVQRLEARFQELADWEELRRLAELQLRFGLYERATRTLQFAGRTLTLDGAQIGGFLPLAVKLLTGMQPDRAPDLLAGVKPLLPKLSDRQEIDRFLDCVIDGGTSAEIVDAQGATRAGRDALSVLAVAYMVVGRYEPAIARFGRLATHAKDGGSRLALARCVTREVLARTIFRCASGPGAKIFDVFPFYNELEMLDLRLVEMGDWVDHFVIVESTSTFTGRPKPLTFQENRSRYAAFADKIIHVVVDDYPPFVAHAWAREFWQRDMGLRVLSGLCAPDDLILITDVDEIVAKRAVEGFTGEFAALKMEQSRYFLNYRRVLPREHQVGLTSVWKARYLKTMGLSYARAALNLVPGRPRIVDAGWHFSSVFAPKVMGEKMKDTSHQEFSALNGAYFEALFEAIRAGEEPEPGWRRVDVDGSFPACVRDRLAALNHILL